MIQNDGTYRNADYALLTNNSNLLFKLKNTTISPSDMDGVLEYKGILNIIIEYKYDDADIIPAQEYAFVNQSKAMNKGGYNGGAYIIVANHTHTEGFIDAGNTIVRKIWRWDTIEEKGKWHNLIGKNLTLKKAIEKLLSFHNIT